MKRTGEGYEKGGQTHSVVSNNHSVDPIKKITRKIMRTIVFINERYPELTKFLDEINHTHPENQTPEMGITLLEQYCESLMEILKNYRHTHTAT